MDQPVATTTPQTNYISNPFKMIGPSANALTVNIGTLFALLGLQLAPLVPLIVAIALGFAVRSNPIAIGITMTLGIASVAAIIIIGLLSLPTFTLILLASVNNQKVGLKETLTKARPFIWRSLGLSILLALTFIGGLLLFIVPAFIFGAWFALSIYALVSEDLGAVASMKRSRELVRGRVAEVWALSALPSLGGFIPFIGGILNMILSVMLLPSMALRYVQLTATSPEARPKPHWSNYAIVALMVVLAIILVIVAGLGLYTSIRSGMNNATYTY